MGVVCRHELQPGDVLWLGVNWFTSPWAGLRYYSATGLHAEAEPYRKPRRPALKSFCYLGVIGALVCCEPAYAQKLVDPNAVAPEYREAAEKRRAEQIRQRECAHKADEAKVLPRDRTAHIMRCLAEGGPTKTSAVAH